MSTERAPDLMPCPFCGGALRVTPRRNFTSHKVMYHLACMRSGDCLRMEFNSEAEAIEMGNRRPSPAPGLEEAVRIARRIGVAQNRWEADEISIILGCREDIRDGITVGVNISPVEARKMVQDIQYELAQLGTAADLDEVVS